LLVVHFDPEDGGSTFLLNVQELLLDFTVPCPIFPLELKFLLISAIVPNTMIRKYLTLSG
jgi:hypothetical protein